MDYETLYVLYQSRKTLLKILAGRGYNIKPYEKFGPVEINAMATAGADSMGMDLELSASVVAPTASGATGAADAQEAPVENPNGGITKCKVLYTFKRIKNRLPTFIEDLVEAIQPDNTEVIVMLVDDTMADAFHTAALSAYAKHKLRIAFFQAHQIVNNPLEHILVPKHERLPTSEHDAFMKKHMIKSKTQLPLIKFHEDMIARILGLVPGDIVKITSYSPSAGEYLKYRVCVP
jgi:DNA-directed RNA polymerase subunit H (RpoH/RPB5)